MLLNCGVGEDSWESLYCKEIQPVHPKRNQSWIFTGRTDAEAETPILWPPKYEELTQNWYNYVKFKNKIKLKKKRNLKKKKRKDPDARERLKAGGEADNRGWDGWMASPTQWTWVWVNSRSWRWTGRPGVLQVHGVATSRTWLSDWSELNWRKLLPSSGSYK